MLAKELRLKKLARLDDQEDNLGAPPAPPTGAPMAMGGQAIVPGGFWRRLVAVIIDGFVMGILSKVVMFPLGLLIGMSPSATGQALLGAGDPSSLFMIFGGQMLVYWVVTFFYFGWFYKNKGATPGKLVMNLRVVDANTGAYVSYWKTFFRETIGRIVSSLPLFLGYWIVAFRDDKRTFHDLMFGTQVVHRKDS